MENERRIEQNKSDNNNNNNVNVAKQKQTKCNKITTKRLVLIYIHTCNIYCKGGIEHFCVGCMWTRSPNKQNRLRNSNETIVKRWTERCGNIRGKTKSRRSQEAKEKIKKWNCSYTGLYLRIKVSRQFNQHWVRAFVFVPLLTFALRPSSIYRMQVTAAICFQVVFVQIFLFILFRFHNWWGESEKFYEFIYARRNKHK